MARFVPITLEEGGAYAFKAVLTEADRTAASRALAGHTVSLSYDGGPFDVFVALAPEAPFVPAKGLNGLSLTQRTTGYDVVAGPIHTVKVVGVGVVTMLAAQRR